MHGAPRLQSELVVSDGSLDLATNLLNISIHAGESPNSSYRTLPMDLMFEAFRAT